MSDDEYSAIARRHVDRGLPVPPRRIVEIGPLAPGELIVAWAPLEEHHLEGAE